MENYEEQEEAAEEGAGDEMNRRLTQKNTLPVWGNKESMNINPMILSNIQGSAYFKEELYKLKTFHEVVDEIYYKVEHLEPWEKGSRKLAGQVGMCGGVRGVAAGGIVSTAYCLLFKLFTLKLTRRQLQAMLDHVDSPYIRGLGFMYIRYCQPPVDFWDWFEPYLDDPEDIDLKAGGGFQTTVGALCRIMLSKLDWFGTMLPRISVNISKVLEQKLKAASRPDRPMPDSGYNAEENGEEKTDVWGEAGRRVRTNDQPDAAAERRDQTSPPRRRLRREPRSRSRDRYQRERPRSRERNRRDSRERNRRRSRSRDRQRRSHSRERRRRSRSRDRRRGRSRSHERRRSRSRERRRGGRSRSRERRRSTSRSGDRRRNRSRSQDRKG